MKKIFTLLTILILITNTSEAAITSLTYDFENDSTSSPPTFITPISDGSTMNVFNSVVTGSNAVVVNNYGAVSNVNFLLDDFPESDYQQLTWKNAYNSSSFRAGFHLRGYYDGASKLNGYYFQVNPALGDVRIYSVDAGASTQLQLYSLTGQGISTVRYFRATVDGTTLTFERSANGSTWTTIGSLSNANHSSGRVYYREGFGVAGAGNAYYDDIIYTYDDSFSGDVVTPSAPLNPVATVGDSEIDLTWELPTDNGGSGIFDYQIEYKLSADMSWSIFNDGVSKSLAGTVTGLTAGQSYDFRISAINSAGAGTASSTVTETPVSLSGSVTITTPVDYQVLQRDGNNLADILITGTYTGTPTAVEARFGSSGAWTTIDDTLVGGNFSGTIQDQTGGQGALTVRFTNDTNVTDSVAYFGIGDIYAVAGQSNNSGRGDNDQVYTHATLRASLFGNDDVWKNLEDPFDSADNQVDSVSSDVFADMGSYVPLLATHFLEDQEVPIAFIPAAKGGVSIDSWAPGTSLYNSMERRIDEVGGVVKGVLWFQGESDGSMTQSEYATKLSALVDEIAADFGGAKTIVGMLGSSSGVGITRNTIRLAQKQVIDENVNAILGPAMYDVNIDDEGADGTHFSSNNDLSIFAERWWYALSKAFYGGADGFGPTLDDDSLYYNAVENTIYLDFTDDSTPAITTPNATTTAFEVLNDGSEITIDSLEYVDSNTIKLTLGSTPNTNEAITLSYAADNRSGIENAVYDSLGLPAMNFLEKNAEIRDVPSLPLNLIVTPGEESASLDWDAPASDGNSTITDYEIQYKLSSDGSWSTHSEGTNTLTSTVISNLVGGSSYDFRVRAVNSLGNSEYESSLNITPTEPEEEVEEAVPVRNSYSTSRLVMERNLLDNNKVTIQSLLMQISQLQKIIDQMINSGQGGEDNDLVCSPVLKVGSKGQNVKTLQTKLGLFSDGIFGNITLEAVKNFQTLKNLLVDGIAGPNTCNLL